jgi:hypothetical protein
MAILGIFKFQFGSQRSRRWRGCLESGFRILGIRQAELEAADS